NYSIPPTHRKKSYHPPRPPKTPRRYSTDSDGFVNIFLQIHVERVFQKPGIAVIIFRHADDDSVAALDSCRECRVLHLLTSIIESHREFAHIDELRFYPRALFCLFENESGRVLGLSPLTGCPENHRNKKRTSLFEMDFLWP